MAEAVALLDPSEQEDEQVAVAVEERRRGAGAGDATAASMTSTSMAALTLPEAPSNSRPQMLMSKKKKREEEIAQAQESGFVWGPHLRRPSETGEAEEGKATVTMTDSTEDDEKATLLPHQSPTAAATTTTTTATGTAALSKKGRGLALDVEEDDAEAAPLLQEGQNATEAAGSKPSNFATEAADRKPSNFAALYATPPLSLSSSTPMSTAAPAAASSKTKLYPDLPPVVLATQHSAGNEPFQTQTMASGTEETKSSASTMTVARTVADPPSSAPAVPRTVPGPTGPAPVPPALAADARDNSPVLDTAMTAAAAAAGAGDTSDLGALIQQLADEHALLQVEYMRMRDEHEQRVREQPNADSTLASQLNLDTMHERIQHAEQRILQLNGEHRALQQQAAEEQRRTQQEVRRVQQQLDDEQRNLTLQVQREHAQLEAVRRTSRLEDQTSLQRLQTPAGQRLLARHREQLRLQQAQQQAQQAQQQQQQQQQQQAVQHTESIAEARLRTIAQQQAQRIASQSQSQSQSQGAPLTRTNTQKYVCCGSCQQWLEAPVEAQLVQCSRCNAINNCELPVGSSNSTEAATQPARQEPRVLRQDPWFLQCFSQLWDTTTAQIANLTAPSAPLPSSSSSSGTTSTGASSAVSSGIPVPEDHTGGPVMAEMTPLHDRGGHAAGAATPSYPVAPPATAPSAPPPSGMGTGAPIVFESPALSEDEATTNASL